MSAPPLPASVPSKLKGAAAGAIAGTGAPARLPTRKPAVRRVLRPGRVSSTAGEMNCSTFSRVTTRPTNTATP